MLLKSKLLNILGIAVIVGLSILSILPQPVNAQASWYNASWQYVKKFTINGTTAGVQTNYQMPIHVYYSSSNTSDGTETISLGGVNTNTTFGRLYLGNKCQTTFADLRFLKSDNVTVLDYWIEDYTASANATIWVEFDYIPASPSAQIFYVYYGNSTATSLSSGTNTFLFYDDFERGVADDQIGGQWNRVSGNATISTDHAYSGTRSGRWRGDAAVASYSVNYTASNNIALSIRVWKETANDIVEISQGNGTKRWDWRINATNDLTYWSGGEVDTTKNVTPDVWQLAGITTLDYSAYTYKMYLNYILAATAAVMDTSVLYPNIIDINSAETTVGQDVYFDDFIIRKYASVEPTFGTGGSEEYLLGTNVLEIMSAKVYKNYLTTTANDWLIVCHYNNIYPPYYPSQEVASLFSLQLVSTDNTTVLASSKCQEWGYTVGCIYQSSIQVTPYTWGSSYVVRLQGNFSSSVKADYAIQPGDWVGTDLTRLDSYCISTVSLMETHNTKTYTTYVSGVGKVLNVDGGAIFSTAIPLLSTKRPDLFAVSQSTTTSPTINTNEDIQTGLLWRPTVGTFLESIFDNWGIVFNVSGQNMGTIWIAILMLLVINLGFNKGQSMVGLMACMPVLLMGTWVGLIEFYITAVVLALLAFSFIYQMWFRGAS